MALACHYRLAPEAVQLGLPEVKRGLLPGGGGTQRLPRLIGERRAKWLMFSGEWLSPTDALQFGLVNAVVPKGQAAAKAREMAQLLADKSPVANRNIKEAVKLGMEMDLRTALAVERRIAVDHMQAKDVAIGLEAFRKREKPKFIGR